MRSAILNRISRRKYKNTPIEKEKVEIIKQKIDEINKLSGLSIEFSENSGEAFSSMRKTYGMFSGVSSLFIMKGNSNDPDLAEKIGYFGESLVLDVTDMGLGTCWVAGTFDKSKMKISSNEKMLCVITVGKVEDVSRKEKFIRKSISRNRKPAKERLIGYDEAPDWAKNGIEAVRYAPSAVNSQRPTFYYSNGTVTAKVKGSMPVFLIDLGIAKKHFEEGAKGKFKIGNGAEFQKTV